VNAGRIVPEACPGFRPPLEDPAAVARPRSRPLPVVLPAVAQPPRDIPHGNNVPRLTARGARRWLVLHASHLASTSGSQIAVITEPASRAELEPVIASRPGPFPGRCR
jgi:hypothetical protein